jgi:hypothetical protein
MPPPAGDGGFVFIITGLTTRFGTSIRAIIQAWIAVTESIGTYLDAKVHCFGKVFECRSHPWPDVFQGSRRVLRYVGLWTSCCCTLKYDKARSISLQGD